MRKSRERGSSVGRSLLAALVTGFAAAVLVVGLLAAHLNAVLLSPTNFSDRAVTVVRSSSVQSLITDTVTSHLLGYVGAGPSVEPLVSTAVRTAISDPTVIQGVRDTARSLQSGLTSGTADTLTFTLPAIGPLIAARIASQSPAVAAVIARVGAITVVSVPIPAGAANALHTLTAVARDWLLILVLAGVLALLALLIAPRRRRAVVWLGLGAAVGGLLLAAGYAVGRGLVVGALTAPGAGTTAGVIWRVYLGGLERTGFVLAAAGLVVALVAALLRPRRQWRAY